MSQLPVASVVFTTYNQPDWLEKVLIGFGAQDRHDFEILVADDGSGEETRRRIEAVQARLPVTVRHLWQADDGFRKCEALNMAVAASAADYLIFTDGDCIPRRDFVSTHLRLREPGRFLSGGYHKLPMATSQAITADDILHNRCFELDWLRGHGMPGGFRNLKIGAGPRLRRVLDALSTARASWNGHNASAWKRDIVAVNGFDERMRYGGEDREFGERLENAGIRGKRIRYRAIVVHLDHKRGYVTEEGLQANRRIRAATRASGSRWTAHGLVKSPSP
ncbi:glycosyltransferase family 2 protein [Pseudoxanthomonas mexicana]|uniref:glycosyltransferase family 2 protein n=1 Tax=Pseudoxanthomonas mexicana TaxID=128785 RepID=UPI00398A941B